MFTRSTKGASKQRRELINVEINNIRDMLPLQEGIRKRLSQLQVMAICKAFIGKNNFFEKIASMPCSSSEENQLSFEFSQALPGFLLMASIDGKFLYLSDNVMEILGHSMVDFVTQSETIFDLFDERGQAQVMKLLSGGHGNREDFASGSTTGECSLDEISFTCLMGLSKNVRRHPGLDRQKVMKVRARLTRPANYLEGGEPVLVAFCCPWSPVMPTGDQVPAFSTTVCQTRHSMDMKFLDIDANGQFHLGYSANELQLQSWYRFIHPDHEAEFASKHLEVISNGPDCVSSIFIRVQTKYGHFIWLHVIMRMLPGSEFSTGQSEIACISHVLDEEEVTFRKEREQLEAEMGDYSGSAHLYKSQGNGMYQVPTAIVDDRFLGAPVGYMSQPDMWNENEVRGKRKSTGDDAYGRPRKMRSFTASEDSASSASSSSMMYSSPIGLDVDRSLQSDQMETCLSRDFFPADFNMKLEDPFQPKALSPYSMLSDSIGSSSSPRMYPEDDGSFFRSMSASPKQKNIHSEVSDLSLLNGGIGPINDLTNLKTLVPEAMMLASPNQEAPKELPELDLTDLNDYLKTVEDGKKPRVLANLGDLSYAEYLPPAYDWNHRVLQQKQTQHLPEKCASLTYEPQQMQGEEFCYDKPMASRNNSGFSSVAFLESLIESPQFTELIGMMANGPQKHLGFQEQGLSCFG